VQTLAMLPIALGQAVDATKSDPETMKREAQAKLAWLRTEIQSLEELIESLKAEIEQKIRDSEWFVPDALGLDDFRIELTVLEEAMKTASSEFTKLKTEANDPARVLPFEKATVTNVNGPDTPRKLRYAGIAAAGAFALVLLAIGLLEFRNRRQAARTGSA